MPGTHNLILLRQTFFGGGSRGVRKNVCQILETINFLGGEIAGKTLSVRKKFYVKTKRSHLNLDESGIGNEIPDCRSRIGTVRILL